jgi:hypothetical protein
MVRPRLEDSIWGWRVSAFWAREHLFNRHMSTCMQFNGETIGEPVWIHARMYACRAGKGKEEEKSDKLQ